MSKFDELVKVADKLLGPGGCPWDRTQTFASLQPYVLEEAHEVIEAVTEGDDAKIVQELGDLFYTVIFYGKVAEKEKRFTLDDVIEAIREKLVRRHPHVFGEVKADTPEEVIHHWEKIKKQEKGHEERTSALDGIPKTLTALPRAQKMLKKMRRAGYSMALPKDHNLGHQILELLLKAEEDETDAEMALRGALQEIEKAFRTWESQ